MENKENNVVLENVISTAIQIPGVKVTRDQFLAVEFPAEKYSLAEIIEKGPVAAGICEKELSRIADRVIIDRTAKSSIASFVAGIPGGLAMAATIPADLLQFFGVSLRLAQELSYLYGTADFWNGDQIDEEKVRNQLILYIGVMFGVSGAVTGVRVLSVQLAKVAALRIPAKALTKTIWYPVLKKVLHKIGYELTKKAFANGVAKVIPVLGGIVAGGLNFFSMKPMAENLKNVLAEASFHYTEEMLEKDIIELENIKEDMENEEKAENKKADERKTAVDEVKHDSMDEKIAQIRKLKGLYDEGLLSEEEFAHAKERILSSL